MVASRHSLPARLAGERRLETREFNDDDTRAQFALDHFRFSAARRNLPRYLRNGTALPATCIPRDLKYRHSQPSNVTLWTSTTLIESLQRSPRQLHQRTLWDPLPPRPVVPPQDSRHQP